MSRKTIWVQHVAVNAKMLGIRLEAAGSGGNLTAEQEATAAGVREFIDKAEYAANRVDPVPSRIVNWWRGVLVEAAYRNMHAARAQIVQLLPEVDVEAEIPSAVARAHAVMNRDDPRCISEQQLVQMESAKRKAWLRMLIEDGYEGVDQKHAQLRSFRNIILMAAIVTILLVAATLLVVANNPTVMPLCFKNEVAKSATVTAQQNLNCPTRENTTAPSGGDILVVGLMGLLGGALATTVAIRKLENSSTPYDVPVALAWLKVPLGAFTAILGILAISAGFVPGLSVLDSQQQILAYALLLGFAQQAFTRVLDSRAQALNDTVPSRETKLQHRGAVTTQSLGQRRSSVSAGPRATTAGVESGGAAHEGIRSEATHESGRPDGPVETE